METVILWMDPYLIKFFRLTGFTFVDFLLGTFIVAWIALMIGEFCISVVFLISRKRIAEVATEVERYRELSEKALEAGNLVAYKAANDLGNDAFGRQLFMQIAYSAALLWPVFIALTWMGFRFQGVEFDFAFTGWIVSYPCVFIVLYVAAYLIFKRLKQYIPYFKRIQRLLNQSTKSPPSFSSITRTCKAQNEPCNGRG